MEVAFVIPVLTLLVFGMIELGLTVKDSLALNQVAREAVRAYAIGETPNLETLATDMDLANPSTVSAAVVNSGTRGTQVSVALSYPHTPLVWKFSNTQLTLYAKMVMRHE